MFAVIFQVQPKQDRFDDYLAIAKELRPKLEAIDGFIDNERFRSTRDGRWLLSLSTWRDEKTLVRWRTQGEHHGAQQKGRFEVFADYHLRVGEVFSDSHARTPAQHRTDTTEIGRATVVTITQAAPAEIPALAQQLGFDRQTAGLVDHETFESITTPGHGLLLASWTDATAAEVFRPSPPDGVKSFRHRTICIVRDYGMFERREAPQFYPAVRRD